MHYLAVYETRTHGATWVVRPGDAEINTEDRAPGSRNERGRQCKLFPTYCQIFDWVRAKIWRNRDEMGQHDIDIIFRCYGVFVILAPDITGDLLTYLPGNRLREFDDLWRWRWFGVYFTVHVLGNILLLPIKHPTNRKMLRVTFGSLFCAHAQ